MLIELCFPFSRRAQLCLKSHESVLSVPGAVATGSMASLIAPGFLLIPSLPLRVLTRNRIDLDFRGKPTSSEGA
jgi:hypothetical protein